MFLHVCVCRSNFFVLYKQTISNTFVSRMEDQSIYTKTMIEFENVKIDAKEDEPDKDDEIMNSSAACQEEDEEKEEEKLAIDLPNEPPASIPFSVFDYIPCVQPFRLISEVNCDFGLINNYTKGCKWAPDGSCLIVCSDDQHLRLFNVPNQLTSIPVQLPDNIESNLAVALDVREGGLVYDYCFNPLMNSADEKSSFFVATSSGQPIHMWDAYHGRLIQSFKGYDQYHEMISAYSIAIDGGQRLLFAGYHKTIKVFDMQQGDQINNIRTCDKQNGQTGIISCLAINPANSDVLAAGSYGRQLALYSQRTDEQICVLLGQRTGLTQLQFSYDGTRLLSCGRKNEEILCWDMRNLSQVLFALKRPATTNQRIYFDASASFNQIVSGDQNGYLHWWSSSSSSLHAVEQEDYLPVMFSEKLHSDCINGVSIHPSLPVIATTSGQRHFRPLIDDNENELDFDEKPNGQNCLRIWWTSELDQFNQLYSSS